MFHQVQFTAFQEFSWHLQTFPKSFWKPISEASKSQSANSHNIIPSPKICLSYSLIAETQYLTTSTLRSKDPFWITICRVFSPDLAVTNAGWVTCQRVTAEENQSVACQTGSGERQGEDRGRFHFKARPLVSTSSSHVSPPKLHLATNSSLD